MHPHPFELDLVNFTMRQNHRDALNQHNASLVRQARRPTGTIASLRTRIMAMLGGFFATPGPEHDPRQIRSVGLAPPE